MTNRFNPQIHHPSFTTCKTGGKPDGEPFRKKKTTLPHPTEPRSKFFLAGRRSFVCRWTDSAEGEGPRFTTSSRRREGDKTPNFTFSAWPRSLKVDIHCAIHPSIQDSPPARRCTGSGRRGGCGSLTTLRYDLGKRRRESVKWERKGKERKGKEREGGL